MSIFNSARFDTTPGATGEFAVLAPPADVTTAEAYLDWLRWARSNDGLRCQVMTIAARSFARKSIIRPPEITGPLSSTLTDALLRLGKWIYSAGNQQDGPPAPSMKDRFERQQSQAPQDILSSDSQF